MKNDLPMNVMRRNDAAITTYACNQNKPKLLLLFFALNLIFCSPGVAQEFYVYNPETAKTFNRFYNNSFPEITLEQADGSLYNTANLAGKTVYVDFWFTTCPPCIKEMPHSQMLQKYFIRDTNVVFLNICIENIERKPDWRKMVNTNNLQGINLFYARNRPQKINLLRQLGVDNFPLYLLVHNMKIIGYNAPAPSEKGFVHWAILNATKNISLSSAYTSLATNTAESRNFLQLNHFFKAAAPLKP